MLLHPVSFSDGKWLRISRTTAFTCSYKLILTPPGAHISADFHAFLLNKAFYNWFFAQFVTFSALRFLYREFDLWSDGAALLSKAIYEFRTEVGLPGTAFGLCHREYLTSTDTFCCMSCSAMNIFHSQHTNWHYHICKTQNTLSLMVYSIISNFPFWNLHTFLFHLLEGIYLFLTKYLEKDTP